MERVRFTGHKGKASAGKLRKRSTEPKPEVPSIPRLTLNEELTKRFCRLIRRGLPPDSVCNLLGISGRTFWVWMQRGMQFIEGDREPKEWAIYGYFYFQYKKAHGVFMLRVHKDLSKDVRYWAKHMTILERRDRRNYGRYDQPGGDDTSMEPDERFI
jgi:hypothetical protein